MVEIIWEFVVREEHRGQFELVFGPGGAWSKLFSRSPGFQGTALLRDTKNPNRYLATDVWDNESLRVQVQIESRTAYDQLEADLAEWTESRREIGIFRLRTQATVRPQIKSKGRRT